MLAQQRAFTDQAVRSGLINQAEADRFTKIHDLLIESGLMQYAAAGVWQQFY
jgi:hypothetical protein